MPKAVSKAQAGLFGIIAGGGTPSTKVVGLSEKEAKKMLKGVHVADLPEHVKKKGKK